MTAVYSAYVAYILWRDVVPLLKNAFNESERLSDRIDTLSEENEKLQKTIEGYKMKEENLKLERHLFEQEKLESKREIAENKRERQLGLNRLVDITEKVIEADERIILLSKAFEIFVKNEQRHISIVSQSRSGWHIW